MVLCTQNSIAVNKKTYFDENEYGVLYWKSEGDWSHNWRFKTKANFKLLEIGIFDQNGKYEVLVDNETMNGYAPLEFGFRLNNPKLMGSKANPTLSIPFGYSRIAVIGKGAMGLSNWAQIEGDKLINVEYDNNPTFDDLDKSGEIILATYKTSDHEKEKLYTIKIKYEK